MKQAGVSVLAVLLLSLVPAYGQSAPATVKKKILMTKHANGTFDVKIAPAESSSIGQQAEVGRMTIDKTFSGALEGVSKGEMLTGITASTGSMAYVAIERVTGKIEGRSGSFILMHNATMMKGNPKAGELHVVVVPSSGTGELEGLSGQMNIVIDGTGKHTYEFKYTLP